MLELDHVIVAVGDLDEAAGRFEADYGLVALPGGRHPGFGTGNRIVPLGRSYVELMAVVDEDEPSALADWVGATSAAGAGLGALCLRTDDVEGVAARLGVEALPMGRSRPDGVELRWKLAGLDAALATPGLPFFIQWDVRPGDFPGETSVEHPSGATGLAWVEVAGDPEALARRLGADVPGLRVSEGEPGIRALGIAAPGGEIVIR